MSTRAFAYAAIVFGLATLGVFAAFSFLPEVQGAYQPGMVGPALSLFQRAETTADLNAVFGVPANQAALTAMHAVNQLDLWLFIPAYTLFLIAAAMVLTGGARTPLALLAILFALAGAGADAIETIAQLAITGDYDSAPAHLPIAPWHWLKYGALAAHAWVAAAICLLGAPRRWIVGALSALPLPFVLLAWLGVSEPRLFSIAFALAWLALLGAAIKAALPVRSR